MMVTRSLVVFALVLASIALPAGAATLSLQPLASAQTAIVDGSSICRVPSSAAQVDGIAEYPAFALSQGAAGRVGVGVDLASSGSLRDTWIQRSSGNQLLDRSALRAARTSRYVAERQGCTAVGGRYLLLVDYEL
ncbi:MAG: hypothetical protein PVSMB8_14070 [Vulcanimicrobiaceae bacterium]